MKFNQRQLTCCILFIMLIICEFILMIWWINELQQYGQIRDDPAGTFGAVVISAVAFLVLLIEEMIVWVCTHYLLRDKAKKSRGKTMVSASLLTITVLLIALEVYKIGLLSL